MACSRPAIEAAPLGVNSASTHCGCRSAPRNGALAGWSGVPQVWRCRWRGPVAEARRLLALPCLQGAFSVTTSDPHDDQPRRSRRSASFVYRNVARSAVLLTDDLPAYKWIGGKFPAHLAVNHSRGEYVRRDPLAAAKAHVNTAESRNAILKRCWVGVHHWWSIKPD